MKKITTYLIILTALITSCGQKKDFLTGTWTIDNLNSVDSSANRETLFNTFLVTKYTTSNLLSFSDNKTVVLRTPTGQDIGTGTYLIEGNGNSIIINFPVDKIKSVYKITAKTNSTLKLTAYDDSETVNISLTKKADN